MATKGIVDVASTNGWDTVFGIHIADANAAIAKAKSSPKTFDVSDKEDGISATGTFKDWQISTGGSGAIVRLVVPIATAVIKSGTATTDTVKDATARVDVRLNFLHQLDAAGKGSHHLRVKTTTESKSEEVATVVSIDYAKGQKLSFIAKAGFQTLLSAWLNSNLDDFDHVFATVDLNRKADQGAFQWIQPTDVAYAYSDLGAGDGLLGVLCMTGKRSSDELVQQLSPALIHGKERAGFLISKNRMLEEMLLPSMPHVFKGTKVSDYKMSASGDSILNAHGNISFTTTTKAFTAKDGTHCPPKTTTSQIQELSITIDGTELQMEVLTKTNLSPGIDAFCRTRNFLNIELVERPDGTQTLGFKDARNPPPAPKHWTVTAPGIAVTEEILGYLAAILALVAIVLTDGAAVGVVALILALVAGLMTVTTEEIESFGEDDAPAITDLVLNATAAITWPDSKDFKLGYAGLDDSLLLGGDPQFA